MNCFKGRHFSSSTLSTESARIASHLWPSKSWPGSDIPIRPSIRSFTPSSTPISETHSDASWQWNKRIVVVVVWTTARDILEWSSTLLLQIILIVIEMRKTFEKLKWFYFEPLLTLVKAALRRAFYACIYCMSLRFQRNYFGWLEPKTKSP